MNIPRNSSTLKILSLKKFLTAHGPSPATLLIKRRTRNAQSRHLCTYNNGLTMSKKKKLKGISSQPYVTVTGSVLPPSCVFLSPRHIYARSRESVRRNFRPKNRSLARVLSHTNVGPRYAYIHRGCKSIQAVCTREEFGGSSSLVWATRRLFPLSLAVFSVYQEAGSAGSLALFGHSEMPNDACESIRVCFTKEDARAFLVRKEPFAWRCGPPNEYTLWGKVEWGRCRWGGSRRKIFFWCRSECSRFLFLTGEWCFCRTTLYFLKESEVFFYLYIKLWIFSLWLWNKLLVYVKC